MRALVFSSLFLSVLCTQAQANIPNPALSTIPNVLISNGGLDTYAVTIVGQLGPVNQALVELVVSTEADGVVCWCVGQVHPMISAMTNTSGVAVFNIAGGGCIDPASLTGGIAVEVFANGFKMAEVGIVSVDAVDSSGILPSNGWNPGTSCTVGLSDATFHSGPIASGIYSFCSDLDSDGSVGLQDGVMATDPIVNGIICTRQ